MLMYLIVAACFLGAAALTVAAVVLSSRLNQDSYEVYWLAEEEVVTAVPGTPESDQSTA